MEITSIYLDTVLPTIPGMLNIRDFLVHNFFEDMPPIPNGTIPIAGFYWGPEQPNITDNGYKPELPATVHGEPSNATGRLVVDRNNYLDTNLGGSLSEWSWAAGVYRPMTNPDQSLWYFSNFQGAGSDATGWAVGVGNNGRLRVGYQTLGRPFAGFDLDWPSSVAPGGKCAISGIVWGGRITIAVYDPLTDNYVSSGGNTPIHTAFNRNFLVGAKYDNNLFAGSAQLYALLVFPEDIAGVGHTQTLRYLYNKVA